MGQDRERVVRDRRETDLAPLAALLAEQQPASGYPFRWPLPFPVEDFLVRESEERAWVGELDGVVVGHVAVGRVPDDGLGELFRRATGCPDPALVSALVVAVAARGRGVAGALLDIAVGWARAQDRVPVLDVLPTNADAAAVYRHRGWREIGRTRFEWQPPDVPDALLMALPPSEPAPGG